MKKLLLLLPLTLPSCVASIAATGPIEKDPSGMTITHESLGGKKHMITVTDTRPGLGTLSSSNQSMSSVAYRYAAKTCPKGFDMDTRESNLQHTAFSSESSKTFVFTEH